MPKKGRFLVEYSRLSLSNAKEIVSYLRLKFTDKEVTKFYQLLLAFEESVSLFPYLYPESQKKKIRRAVLSNALSVYYAIGKDKISIIAILDNRWNANERLR